MSLKVALVHFALFSAVFAKTQDSAKPSGKVFARFFDSSDPENDLEAKTFAELRRSLKSSPKLRFKEVDCSQHDCSKISNKTTSAFLLFNRSKLVDVYYGPHELESLRNYCLVQMGFELPRSLPVAAETATGAFTALQLSSNNFDEGIKKGLTFVIFYACWCGHCQKFRPFWNELTEKYKDHQVINIRRVDCMAEQQSGLCYRQKITGFPTIGLYKDGKWWKEYEGGRKLFELYDFVDSHLNEGEIKGWELREELREIERQKKEKLRAARKALDQEKARLAALSSCHVETEHGLCMA